MLTEIMYTQENRTVGREQRRNPPTATASKSAYRQLPLNNLMMQRLTISFGNAIEADTWIYIFNPETFPRLSLAQGCSSQVNNRAV